MRLVQKRESTGCFLRVRYIGKEPKRATPKRNPRNRQKPPSAFMSNLVESGLARKPATADVACLWSAPFSPDSAILCWTAEFNEPLAATAPAKSVRDGTVRKTICETHCTQASGTSRFELTACTAGLNLCKRSIADAYGFVQLKESMLMIRV